MHIAARFFFVTDITLSGVKKEAILTQQDNFYYNLRNTER